MRRTLVRAAAVVMLLGAECSPSGDTGDPPDIAYDDLEAWLAPRRRLAAEAPPATSTMGYACGAYLVFGQRNGERGHRELRMYRRDTLELAGVTWTHRERVEHVFGVDAYDCVAGLLAAGECVSCVQALPDTSASACAELIDDDRCAEE